MYAHIYHSYTRLIPVLGIVRKPSLFLHQLFFFTKPLHMTSAGLLLPPSHRTAVAPTTLGQAVNPVSPPLPIAAKRLVVMGMQERAWGTCVDTVGFSDARGGCAEYDKSRLCTAEGRGWDLLQGGGWDAARWGQVNPNALAACCSCGGGNWVVGGAATNVAPATRGLSNRTRQWPGKFEVLGAGRLVLLSTEIRDQTVRRLRAAWRPMRVS